MHLLVECTGFRGVTGYEYMSVIRLSHTEKDTEEQKQAKTKGKEGRQEGGEGRTLK